MRLEDIRPLRSSFKLAATQDREYFIRPFSLDDEIWMNKTFGADGIKAIFDRGEWPKICQIAYHQLEDKEPFLKQKITLVNEEGEKAEHEVGGVKLFHALVRGQNEKLNIIQALLEAIGISRPMQNDMIADEVESLKKKQDQRDQNQSGMKSSTSSPANTDGPAPKSQP